MGNGYIFLDRRLLGNPLFKRPGFVRLWVYCLSKTQYKDSEALVRNQPVRRFRRILPDERKWLECEQPLSLRQEVAYLIQGRTPPITFVRCLWKAVRRRLSR